MSYPKRIDPETERKIVDAYISGETLQRITDKFKVGDNTVYRLLKAYRIDKRMDGKRKDIDRVKELCPSAGAAMEAKRMTLDELAERVGYNEIYTRNIMVGTAPMPGIFAIYVAQALEIDARKMKEEADAWWMTNMQGRRMPIRRRREAELSYEDVCRIVQEYKAGNKPVYEIGRQWSISGSMVSKIAKRAGCEMRVGRRRTVISDRIRREIVKDYKAHMRVDEICGKYNIPVNRMYETIKESGCEMRNRRPKKG